MTKKKYTIEDVKKAVKPIDAWWTVLVIDPFANRFTLFIANWTNLNPTFFSLFCIVSGIFCSFLFYKGVFIWGAIVYEIAFFFDCIDGRLARLKNAVSPIGEFLDELGDQVRVYLPTFALACATSAWKLIFVFFGLYLWNICEAKIFDRISSRGLKFNAPTQLKESTFIKFRNRLWNRRLTKPFSEPDREAVVFFICPLLSVPVIGFIIAICMNILSIIMSHIHFWKYKYK